MRKSSTQRRILRGLGTTVTVVALAFGILPAGEAARAATSERWIATSTTAIAITGDLSFTSRSLRFASGKRLSIRYIGKVAGNVSFVPDAARTATGELYRVTSSADPELIAGNRLCGRLPTFVTVRRDRTRAGTDILLTVYSGSAAPRGTPTDAICAGYAYALAGV